MSTDTSSVEDDLSPESLTPPTLRGSRFGAVGEMLKMWRHRRKMERLAGKGYVCWYRVDDTWPQPKFVKPEDTGSGIREYEDDDGDIYFFPKSAAKPSAETGMWTFVHQRGDPEPLNVVDYRETIFTADQASEWADQKVESESPESGMFDFISDLSRSQIMAGGIALTMILAVVLSQGGGL